MINQKISTPKDETLTWQNINDRVTKGFKLQEINELKLSDDDILIYNDAIIVAPDYQREYRSSISDESSLIESALLQIPIPPIFLANHKIKGVQVLNVVDGQHRLRAFYRFLNNKFKLKELKILNDFNGKYFKDLAIDVKSDLLSRSVNAITFRDFPGKEFELEIFYRYNKGTKPLSPQEIRHAVYGSGVNDMVNNFCTELNNDRNSSLSKAYAVSSNRYQKKNLHENVFVILSIIEDGLIQEYKNDDGREQKITKSPEYADAYMKKKALEQDDSVKEILADFNKFNDFIKYLTKITEFPFSREIYGVSFRGNKFQISISMILAGIYRKMNLGKFNFDNLKKEEKIEKLGKYLEQKIGNSFLEDPTYKASSTNPEKIREIVDGFKLDEVM